MKSGPDKFLTALARGCAGEHQDVRLQLHLPHPQPILDFNLGLGANATTDAFNSVAANIRDDPELLNYMVAGMGPGVSRVDLGAIRISLSSLLCCRSPISFPGLHVRSIEFRFAPTDTWPSAKLHADRYAKVRDSTRVDALQFY